MKHGKGIYTYSNGNKFDGQYFRGDMQKGILTLINGDIYEGEFMHDKLHG